MSESRISLLTPWVGFFLVGVLFSSPLSTIQSLVSVDKKETEQKTASLPAISKLVFSASFVHQRVLVSQWLVLPLAFFPLPVDTNASASCCACTYTGVYRKNKLIQLVFFHSLKPMFAMTFFFYFSSCSGCLEAWLHLLPAVLSVYLSWSILESKMCVEGCVAASAVSVHLHLGLLKFCCFSLHC